MPVRSLLRGPGGATRRLDDGSSERSSENAK
jgi:hypothetical protein